MGYRLELGHLNYAIQEKQILKGVSFDLPSGAFAALLGENGSGKSTLLDLVMGFRLPQAGSVRIAGIAPHLDDLALKRNIIFLSEKMEVPVYWKVGDYLDFHRYFYPTYSLELEAFYLAEYRMKREISFRSLSAGENKRAQIVAALASNPQLLLVDEITAVLDIVGRQKFMKHLLALHKTGATVVLATNILEDLEHFASHLILLNHGAITYFGEMAAFIQQQPDVLFSQHICDRLQAS